MRRTRLSFIPLLVALAVAITALLHAGGSGGGGGQGNGGGGGGNTSTSVDLTFLGGSIAGDGLGTYSADLGGGNGLLILRVEKAKRGNVQRKITFDFTDPVLPSSSLGEFTSSEVFFLVAPVEKCKVVAGMDVCESECVTVTAGSETGEACENLPDGFQAIAPPYDTGRARVVANFLDEDDDEFRFRTGTTITGNGTVGIATLGTDFVDVACTGDDGNGNCIGWQITADGDVGRLFQHIPRIGGDKSTPRDDELGDFFMSWSATVTVTP